MSTGTPVHHGNTVRGEDAPADAKNSASSSDMSRGMKTRTRARTLPATASPASSSRRACKQGLTVVHFSAQPELVWSLAPPSVSHRKCSR